MNNRCAYSDEYKIVANSNAKKERTGTIVGESRDKQCWVVIWDGRKSAENVYKSYINSTNNSEVHKEEQK